MLSSAAIVNSAVEARRRSGEPAAAALTVIAAGPGWRIADIVCTADADDEPFEETHAFASIAVVAAGAFSYHGAAGRTQLTTGAMLLGNPGARFCCGHEHAAGDRCIAFQLAPDQFEALWSLHCGGSRAWFPGSAIPASADLTALVSTAEAFAHGELDIEPADLLNQAMARAVSAESTSASKPMAHGMTRRVFEIARAIEADPAFAWTLPGLADMAGSNQFYFLRCFKQLCGLTPHAFVRQLRLREAARLLLQSELAIAQVALEAGFGDLSTFNHTFKRAYGCPPGQFRARRRRERTR